MAAPLIGAAALAARLIARQVAQKSAKKSAVKLATRAKKNLNKPVAKSKKPVEKITGVKANPKKAAPKSNVKSQKASKYTQDNLNKMRTPEGTRRATEAARKAEQMRVGAAARRMLKIEKMDDVPAGVSARFTATNARLAKEAAKKKSK